MTFSPGMQDWLASSSLMANLREILVIQTEIRLLIFCWACHKLLSRGMAAAATNICAIPCGLLLFRTIGGLRAI
jgi:hypothetical protein